MLNVSYWAKSLNTGASYGPADEDVSEALYEDSGMNGLASAFVTLRSSSPASPGLGPQVNLSLMGRAPDVCDAKYGVFVTLGTV